MSDPGPRPPLDPPALATIHARHSIRQFTDRPVSEADLATLLAAANTAPSAHNQQAWRFLVIGGGSKRALVDLITANLDRFPRAASVLLRMAARSIAGAPVVIAVANTGELIEHGTRLFRVDPELGKDFFRTMEIQSSAAAVQNLLLAATALGLGTVWLGILYLLKDEMLDLLGEPKGEFMAVIPVGYPAHAGRGPEKRPLDKTVTYLL
jgi:nitroreductase